MPLPAACDAAPARQEAGGAEAPAAPVPPVGPVAAAPLATDGWIGRWTGPEGLFLTIAKGDAPGRYAMTIKGDPDGEGDAVTGTAEGEAIRFERNGKAETPCATDGAGTGLRWLGGKRDCLVVQPGEGVCRD